MIYATTPQGMTIEYPTARCIECSDTINKLYVSDGGRFVASLPREWALSFVKPSVDNDIRLTEAAALLIVAGNIREMASWQHYKLIAKIKRELRDFDSRRQVWK